MAECARVCVEEGITGTVLKPRDRRLSYVGVTVEFSGSLAV
jgi:hypothetical protein